ncbi:MAG: hypothetical protein PUB15_07635 [Ruminobacter sp.]|nr:hypothetical protein [Ruminobacter sp.]MDY5779835.1 hypothetical protein [Succinivibrionaceae bacterium]
MMFFKGKQSLVLVLTLLGSGLVLGEDFEAPEAPPELGETLTSYKTRQMLLDEAIRQNQETNAKEELESNAPKANKQVVHYEPKDEEPEVKELNYFNTRGSKFNVPNKGFITLQIFDPQGVLWPISDAIALNNSFKTKVQNDLITIESNTKDARLAKIKVFLASSSEPLEFIVMNDPKQNSRKDGALHKITIGQKSPLNSSKEELGMTNMVKTSKARNSFREVETQDSREKEIKAMQQDNENAFRNPFASSKVYVVNRNIPSSDYQEVMDTLSDALIKVHENE